MCNRCNYGSTSALFFPNSTSDPKQNSVSAHYILCYEGWDWIGWLLLWPKPFNLHHQNGLRQWLDMRYQKKGNYSGVPHRQQAQNYDLILCDDDPTLAQPAVSPSYHCSFKI